MRLYTSHYFPEIFFREQHRDNYYQPFCSVVLDCCPKESTIGNDDETFQLQLHLAYGPIPKLSCLDVYLFYLEMLHTSNIWIFCFSDVEVGEERVNATLRFCMRFLGTRLYVLR